LSKSQLANYCHSVERRVENSAYDGLCNLITLVILGFSSFTKSHPLGTVLSIKLALTLNSWTGVNLL
jgi:hypothetical protein